MSTVDLLGERAPEPSPSAARLIILDYRHRFLREFGIPPRIVWKRDMRNIEELVQLWGAAVTRTLVTKTLFETSNPRVQRSDRSLLLVYDMAQELLLDGASKAEGRTRRNAEAIKRALGIGATEGRDE